MNITLHWWSALLAGILYCILVFIACFFGFLGPVCWIMFPAVAALLGAGPYCWLAARWQKFGVGTFFALLISVLLICTGEATGALTIIIVMAGGIISDLVRLGAGNSSKNALYAAYPFLAAGLIGWIIDFWMKPEWYIATAAEEMDSSYAAGLTKIQTPLYLLICIIAVVAFALLGVWLCSKLDKKS